MVEVALIEVERDFDAFADHLRSYEVIIDEATVGQLRPGEFRVFEVSPGSHEVFLKLDWCRSEKVNVHLVADQAVRFRCAPRANIFTGFYWASFGRRRYIRLTQATG